MSHWLRLLKCRIDLLSRVASVSMSSDNWLRGCVHGTGERIALQMDRPSEYSFNTYAPSGPTIAQHRLLMARGWAVIRVPGYMWMKLDDAVRGAWLLQARYLT